MKRLALVCVVFGCASVAAAAASAVPPLWLTKAARATASRLSDGSRPVSIVYIGARSRFPRVVLTGSFVCNDCSHGPSNAAAPSGTVAELRFDGETHQTRDFAICTSRSRCDAGLCSFGRCTRSQDALDAAFSALDARLKRIPGDPDTFTHRSGTFTCHIYYPSTEMKYIVASCTTVLRLIGSDSAHVRLREQWRPREFRHGAWVRLPTRSHTWLIVERDGGWQTTISSSGDPPPQLPAGSRK